MAVNNVWLVIDLQDGVWHVGAVVVPNRKRRFGRFGTIACTPDGHTDYNTVCTQ